MSSRREHRASRASLFDGFDGLEEGGLRVSSSHSHGTNDHDNENAVDSLQDRVIFLKKLTGDIHEEVESHNRLLDRMGNDMDSSRGIMSGTMDRFKMGPQIFHAWLKSIVKNPFCSLVDGCCEVQNMCITVY
ncbi:hypothetical protein CIPAW_01G188200 [Carya illinoinensis]|uniref:t-SNARE coiled-coil homology domain-containing protein n=1 Tax=Carya illinoinensis TaxID=32201 RepID=A0A8T1RP84_CARIL|nr:hypothetical protein CIPAW_01G188200 [Carya illinoinensis]KAG6732638.1 hypothetical protein I3842_01G187800 [Carya illinoinensis]